MKATRTSGTAWRWGPWVLLGGFLLASLGGLTNADCFLCTWPELLSVLIGAAVALVGAGMWLFRSDDRPLARALAVLVVVGITLTAAIVVRFVVPPMLWESPHAEGLPS